MARSYNYIIGKWYLKKKLYKLKIYGEIGHELNTKNGVIFNLWYLKITNLLNKIVDKLK